MSNPNETWMQIHFNATNRNEPPPTTAATRRPIRRRSRASRRTPTTLLNTDTTNFRAMVQHFTGGPTTTAVTTTTTYAARPQPDNAAGLYNFSALAPAPSGFQVQYSSQVQQQHMIMVDNMAGRGGGSSHAPPETSYAGEERGYDNYMF